MMIDTEAKIRDQEATDSLDSLFNGKATVRFRLGSVYDRTMAEELAEHGYAPARWEFPPGWPQCKAWPRLLVRKMDKR